MAAARLKFNILHEANKHRFAAYAVEAGVDAVGYLEYALKDNVMDMYHTFVSPKMRGQGLAGQLCDVAFQYAQQQKHVVKPSCSYISDTYVPAHPEAKALCRL